MSALSKLIAQTDSVPEFMDKTLIVNFWASWCSPCRKEMPDLQQLSDTMDKERFLVIGISVDEDKNLMREFLLQRQIHFNNFQDANQHLTRDVLGIRAFPETFIVSPQGVIIRRIVGEQLWNTEAIHSLLESTDKVGHLVQSDRAFG